MKFPAFTYLSRLVSLTTQEIYLVGGSVRDLLIGHEDIKDIDLLMPSGSEDVARTFADTINGSFFFLDQERKITRVVKHRNGDAMQFDFTNFDGADLRADLERRTSRSMRWRSICGISLERKHSQAWSISFTAGRTFGADSSA